MSLAEAFYNFDQLIDESGLIALGNIPKEVIMESRLKKDDLVKKLIDYIENQARRAEAKNNVVNLLQIFTIMVENSKNKSEIQNLFNSNQAVVMILTILTKLDFNSDGDLVKSIF